MVKFLNHTDNTRFAGALSALCILCKWTKKATRTQGVPFSSISIPTTVILNRNLKRLVKQTVT